MFEMTKRLELLVHGRVQLVMFRDYTKRGARRLGLTGTVRNNPEGTVSVVAEGEEERLLKLIERVRTGSLLSRVDRIDEKWMEPSGSFTSFNILYE